MDDRRRSTRDDAERPAERSPDAEGGEPSAATDESTGWGEPDAAGVDRRDGDVRRDDAGADRRDGDRSDCDVEQSEDADERSDDGADDPDVGGVFGARPDDVERPPLRPESPSPENAAFVVLGVLFALFVIYRTIAVLPT